MTKMIKKYTNKLKKQKYLSPDDIEDLCFMLMDCLRINEVTNELTEYEVKAIKSFLDTHVRTRDFSSVH